MAVSPGNARVTYNKGCAFLEWNKRAEAMQSFEEALACDPAFEEARKALGLMSQHAG